MSERKGDLAKQTADCTVEQDGKCPNLKNPYNGMDGERYRCDVCGESYFLDYDDMR